MVLGKPVVATDTGGNNELVQDKESGILVPVQNPQALAEAIMSLIRKPEWASQLGLHGKKLAGTRFGLERMINDYEELYVDTFKQKTRHPGEF